MTHRRPNPNGRVEGPAISRSANEELGALLAAPVSISLTAEARADGTTGETIEFRKPGERQTFKATVTGPGEAVVDLSR